MTKFEVNHLDHVAIYVSDIERSAKWYEEVFGLKQYRPSKWGGYPVFLLKNKTGIALFPSGKKSNRSGQEEIRIDHFAFNVTPAGLEKAKKRYEELGLEYEFQDHYYFHSIYIKDPDGHKVELTTLIVDEDEFYS